MTIAGSYIKLICFILKCFLDRINPEAKASLDTVRGLLREKRFAEAEEMTEERLLAIPEGMRDYELLCELTLEFRTPEHPKFITPHQALWFLKRNMHCYEPKEGVTDYRRSLDLDDGIFRVSYTLDGIPHKREAFISHPAGVLAIRMECAEWRAFLRRASLNEEQIKLDDRTVMLRATTGNGGPSFCCLLRAIEGDFHSVGDMLRGNGNTVLLAAECAVTVLAPPRWYLYAGGIAVLMLALNGVMLYKFVVRTLAQVTGRGRQASESET